MYNKKIEASASKLLSFFLMFFLDQCQGHQVCHVDEVLSSLSEPCPQMGSYLMVDYHCKDGRLQWNSYTEIHTTERKSLVLFFFFKS